MVPFKEEFVFFPYRLTFTPLFFGQPDAPGRKNQSESGNVPIRFAPLVQE